MKLDCYISFILTLSLFFGCKSPEPKETILTGFARGSIANYYLLINKDSTYQLVNHGSTYGTWRMDNDSITLLNGDGICAKIYNNSLVGYYCDEYHVLRIMTFKEIIPPRVVEFPTSDTYIKQTN
jgi:hypothetical protein